MKMAGVSLIAAAIPTPTPASRPCETRQMSVRIRASERTRRKPVTERRDQIQLVMVRDGMAAPHVDAEIQRVVPGGEYDDRRELGAEHAVDDRSNPSPPGHPLRLR